MAETEQPDLVSLVLKLQSPAAPSAEDRPLPLWWGRAAHQAFLGVIREKNDILANELHDSNAPRPFTASSLIGYDPNAPFVTGEYYRLRFTAFRRDVAGLLLDTLASGKLAPGGALELDHLPFTIVETCLDAAADRWAGTDTMARLSAPFLLSKEAAPRKITMHFASPVSFKSAATERIHVPLPLPELVFGSLLNKWNEFAPVKFPEETKRFAAECLAISRYNLRSAVVHTKSRGLRTGGVGSVTYTTVNYDRYWMSVLGTLARFAFYCGVGGGVSQGLGQSRVVGFG